VIDAHLQRLGVVSLGAGVALGRGTSTAPTGAGCGDQQSGVVLERDSRLIRVYITREYTVGDIVSTEAADTAWAAEHPT
jgi:hypothetical protein